VVSQREERAKRAHKSHAFVLTVKRGEHLLRCEAEGSHEHVVHDTVSPDHFLRFESRSRENRWRDLERSERIICTHDCIACNSKKSRANPNAWRAS